MQTAQSKQTKREIWVFRQIQINQDRRERGKNINYIGEMIAPR
jgi:hypothetical protein